MKIISKIIAVAALIGLAACSTSSGTQVDQGQLSQLQKGKTTYAQVVQMFGQPNSTATLPDGSQRVYYAHTTSHVNGASYVPVYGLFAGGNSAQSSMTAMTFDTNGVLKDYTTNNSSMNTRMGN